MSKFWYRMPLLMLVVPYTKKRSGCSILYMTALFQQKSTALVLDIIQILVLSLITETDEVRGYFLYSLAVIPSSYRIRWRRKACSDRKWNTLDPDQPSQFNAFQSSLGSFKVGHRPSSRVGDFFKSTKSTKPSPSVIINPGPGIPEIKVVDTS